MSVLRTLRLSAALGVLAAGENLDAGRVRAADPSQNLERTETDWVDSRNHLRAVDRSGEHLVGVVMVDKLTEGNLSALRSYHAADPFALDPSIANITKNGVSDPNAAHAMQDAGTSTGKGKKGRH